MRRLLGTLPILSALAFATALLVYAGYPLACIDSASCGAIFDVAVDTRTLLAILLAVCSAAMLVISTQRKHIATLRILGRDAFAHERQSALAGAAKRANCDFAELAQIDPAGGRDLPGRDAVLQGLIDNIPGAVCVFDASFRLAGHNAEFKRLFDFPDHLFDGQASVEDFFRFNALRGEYGDGAPEAIVDALMGRARARQAFVFERERPNGSILEIRRLPLPDGGFVTIYTDVTARRETAEVIELLAHRDPLTGLANRNTLEARLDQSLADARRHGTNLALFFIDLDNFKSINDSLGHVIGDEFLATEARRLSTCVRDCDTAGRLGSDEFVLVLADVGDGAAIGRMASKIVAILGHPVHAGGRELTRSASVGISIFPNDGQDRGQLLQNAGLALDHAKSAGRGHYRFFDRSMTEAANERLRLEAELHKAVEHNDFILHFQPQYDVPGQRIVGFEALIRWRLADGTLMAPDRFIPLAEETGLIGEIGAWALRTACETLQRWRSEGLPVVSMAVNLSALQLKRDDFPKLVADVLNETGLPPELLELEITESVAMEDPELMIGNLRALKRLGVGLSIDDFGTGYSSLAYLKLLPIERLKLDRTFVKDMEIDPNDAAICAATISLAHELGLSVVAEGVETQAQCSSLRRLHCDFMQGFSFSRPVPADQARALLMIGEDSRAGAGMIH